MRFHRSATLALVPVLAVGLAACGGGSSGSSSGGGSSGSSGGSSASSSGGSSSGGSTIALKAPNGQLKYDKTSLTASAGEDTIRFTNQGSIPHDVVIASNGKVVGKTKRVTNGTATATVSLKPGTYTFYCSVPGHEQAGMKGTLTVK